MLLIKAELINVAKSKKFIIGGFSEGYAKEYTMQCAVCNGDTFYIDKWNWEECTPICQPCTKKEISKLQNPRFQLPDNVIEGMKANGYTEEETKTAYKRIIELLTRANGQAG